MTHLSNFRTRSHHSVCAKICSTIMWRVSQATARTPWASARSPAGLRRCHSSTPLARTHTLHHGCVGRCVSSCASRSLSDGVSGTATPLGTTSGSGIDSSSSSCPGSPASSTSFGQINTGFFGKPHRGHGPWRPLITYRIHSHVLRGRKPGLPSHVPTST